MKRFYLFLLCIAIVAGTSALKAKSHDVEQIKLSGSLPQPTMLKSAPVTPQQSVTAYLDNHHIKIEFGSSLGYLTVTVINEQGYPMYQQTVNATAGSSLRIDTRSWSNGTYTLLITNTNGGCLQGQFVK